MIENRSFSNGNFGTHITPLLAAVLHTKEDVIEMGMGDYSTPLLHEIIAYQRKKGSDRKLISFESNQSWLANFDDLACHWHKFFLVDDWLSANLDYNISVLFVDHAPAEQRRLDIIKYAHIAKIVVVHDTDKMNYYQYQSAFDLFQYAFTYKRYAKSTTVLSNFIDVSKFF